MFFRKYGVAAFIAMTLSAGSAMAAEPDTGTITFHGLVSNNTCKISLDHKIDQDGNDFDVTLDTVFVKNFGNDSNLLIVFYVQIMPDDFVMQLHRF